MDQAYVIRYHLLFAKIMRSEPIIIGIEWFNLVLLRFRLIFVW